MSASSTMSSPVEVFTDRLAAMQTELGRRLPPFFAAKRGEAEGTLAELADAVAALVEGGGKRLRPALVAESCRAFGGDPVPVLPVAAATELLQAYLLIHDDIMDHAELRRGVPTVHARFRDEHLRQGWPGDEAEHGRAMAILAGDLAHTWAWELYLDGRRQAAGTIDAAALDRTFLAMCQEVVGGQFLEMRLPLAAGPVAEEDLTRVLRLKSGRYSVERPMELGARLAGVDDPDVLAALSRLGAATGEAFQLKDDVLGVFGDTAELGKSVASDLQEGKHTFLVHYALEAAPSAEREWLAASLGDPELDDDEVDELRDIIRRSGALEKVLERIDRRLADARRALGELPVGEARPVFEGLIEYLGERRR